MGGLISRYYVAGLMPIPNGMPAATRLLMLGTPNLGSPCASIIPHRSAFDLDPEVIAQFNRVVRATNGVELAILAGDAWPTTCHVPGEGDMVVQVTSAFGLPYVTDRQRTDTDHISMTGSAIDAKGFVLPRLTRPVKGGGGSAAGGASQPASFQSPSGRTAPTAAQPLVLAAGVAEVSQGEAVTVAVLVDQLDEIGAVVSAPAGVSVELIPAAPDDAAPPAAVASATTTDDQPLASTDPVAKPAAGTWTLRLTADAAAKTSVAYAVVGRGEGAPSIAVEPDDDELVVTGPGADATVTASLHGPKGRTIDLLVTPGPDGARVAPPADAAGSTVVVSARAEGWERVARHPVVGPDAFKVAERKKATRRPLVTPPKAVGEGAAGQGATGAKGSTGGGIPVVPVAAGVVLVAAAASLLVRRRSSAKRSA